ncbi:MAG: hypothetical protein ACXWJW_05175 [Xanthobacteraceae bacterium]
MIIVITANTTILTAMATIRTDMSTLLNGNGSKNLVRAAKLATGAAFLGVIVFTAKGPAKADVRFGGAAAFSYPGTLNLQ